jgi:serine protease Do
MNKFWSTLLAGATGGLITFGAARTLDRPQPAAPLQPVAQFARQVSYGDGPAPFDFTVAAAKSMPAVVHIRGTESRENASRRLQEQYDSNPFRFFFGDEYGGYDGQPRPRMGAGSGVIYSSDGYIVTNNHVVEQFDVFEVTLYDQREFTARLVGRDPNTDMAVIKIDAKNLPTIELGNSDDVRVGEWALAVGNPFDLASTVTAGIISAKGRDIHIMQQSRAIESFIQTDAAVNPGNSGGALVDVQGRLIGINSAIATPTGVFAGYAFAIPVNLVKRIADDLVKYGKYRRAYLGVDIAPLDKSLADELNIDYTPGVLIKGLDPDGSAAQAGVQAYDVVTGINGRPVTTVAVLRETVGRSKAGDVLTLRVMRSGKERDISVRMSEPKEE